MADLLYGEEMPRLESLFPVRICTPTIIVARVLTPGLWTEMSRLNLARVGMNEDGHTEEEKANEQSSHGLLTRHSYRRGVKFSTELIVTE